MKKVILLTGILVLSIVNLFYSNSKIDSHQDLVLENIDALGVSAGEAYCDPTTTNDCDITMGNVGLAGKGQPIIIF